MLESKGGLTFKVFPATILPDGRKIPLIKGWADAATMDPEAIRLWQELFKERLKYWAIPTGPKNGILVLDVDVKGGGLETIKTLEIPPTLSQRTISGGIHYFYRYPNDGGHYGNKVKCLPGLDVRGEGGYVMYYGADQTPIADPPDWLTDQFIVQPQAQGPSIRVAPEIAEAIITKSLEAIREAPEGESNNVLNVESFKVGQLVSSGSVTFEYAEAALLRAALERGKPVYEARATISSGLAGGGKKPLSSPFGLQPQAPAFILPPPPMVERWTPSRFTQSQLRDLSKLRKPQLFENWSTTDIHITTADGGTGKTTLKLFEAICLALGERFLGFRCLRPGKTLFITGEDTAEKLAAMLGQILRQMGLLEDPQYNDAVETVLESIVVKKDADLCLIVKDRATGFLNPNHDAMRKLLEAVEDIRPKMIVFDPISSFWGSEAALNDMGRAVIKFMSQLADVSGACVEMINHMGKQSSATKDMSQFAARGGTGLQSNARVSRALRTVLDAEYLELTGESLTDKQSAMVCRVNKFTDGSPLYNKEFIILRDGYLFMRKSLSDSKAREAEKSLSDSERVFALVKECRLAGKFPTLAQVQAHFMANGDPLQMTATQRAVNLLGLHGHLGEYLKQVENPDQTSKEKVLVIVDSDGREF